MKTTNRSPMMRRILLGAVMLAVAVGFATTFNPHNAEATGSPTPVSGITPVSALTDMDTTIWKHATNDWYYGLSQSSYQDGVLGVKMTWTSATAGSNVTLTITGYRNTRAFWASTTPSTMNSPLASGLGPSAALRIFFSDTAGTVASQAACSTVTATAVTTVASSGVGGYIPEVAGKMGTLVLNSAGKATLAIVKTSTYKTYVPCLILPNGRVGTGATSGSF